MNLQALKTLLDGSGYPVAYGHFEDPEPLKKEQFPYVVYREMEVNTVYADSAPIYRFRAMAVDLYTRRKEPAAEQRLERILEGGGFTLLKSGDWLEDEKRFVTTYEFEMEEAL